MSRPPCTVVRLDETAPVGGPSEPGSRHPPRWRGARWSNGTTRLFLVAPTDSIFIGLEIYVPRGPALSYRTLRLSAQDPQGRQTYVDTELSLRRGCWQKVEVALAHPPSAGAEVEISITVLGPAPGWPRPVRVPRRGSIRRVWLRGNRVESSQVTIVVLNWNRAAETIRCLESLAESDLGGASVLVVDNGSGDASVETIRARFPKQRILTLPENRGYAGGNNAGMRVALDNGARAVLLLNNDTAVAPDFLSPLLWGLNTHPAAAAVSSAILRMDKPDTLDVAHLDIYFGHGIVHRRGVNAMPGEGFDRFREVEVAVGCSLLLAADALHDVGLFDEAYFAYHEEVDWCWRARQKGYQIFTHPFSRVYHGVSKSTGALRQPLLARRTREEEKPQLANPRPLAWNPVRTYLGARNAVRFVRKNAPLRYKAYFLASTLYAMPLELLAVVMRREDLLWLGLWTYRKALPEYCLELDTSSGAQRSWPARWLRVLARLPRALFVRLPQDVRTAHQEGRTAQLVEHLQGLWDGYRNRPLPLDRLGLR